MRLLINKANKAEIESCVYIGSKLNVDDFLNTKELDLNLTHFGMIGFSMTTMHVNKYHFRLFVINPDKYEQGIRCHKIAHAKFAMICIDNGDNKSYTEALNFMQEVWNCNKLGAIPLVFILGNATQGNYDNSLHEKFTSYIDMIRKNQKLPVHTVIISKNIDVVKNKIDEVLPSYSIGESDYRILPQFEI